MSLWLTPPHFCPIFCRILVSLGVSQWVWVRYNRGIPTILGSGSLEGEGLKIGRSAVRPRPCPPLNALRRNN